MATLTSKTTKSVSGITSHRSLFLGWVVFSLAVVDIGYGDGTSFDISTPAGFTPDYFVL